MGTKRRSTLRAGLATITIGAIVGVVGLAAPTTASADKPEAKRELGKLTLCHRTNAPDNPYRLIEVSFDATNGEIQGPDHTGHPGPAFDFAADPADAGYPYTTPRDGDQWGDIIPPYEWDGGSYPGMNWDDGAAIFAADCQGADEPADPECAEGLEWVDGNEDEVLDEGECLSTDDPQDPECGEDEVLVDGVCTTPEDPQDPQDPECGEDEVLVDGVCTTPEDPQDPQDPECGEDEVLVDGVCTTPEDPQDPECGDDEVLVDGVCTTPEDPQDPQDPAGPQDPADEPTITSDSGTERDPIEVLPSVIRKPQAQVQATTLPRTGADTLPLAQAGVGLILLGLGAVVAAKRDAATA